MENILKNVLKLSQIDNQRKFNILSSLNDLEKTVFNIKKYLQKKNHKLDRVMRLLDYVYSKENNNDNILMLHKGLTKCINFNTSLVVVLLFLHNKNEIIKNYIKDNDCVEEKIYNYIYDYGLPNIKKNDKNTYIFFKKFILNLKLENKKLNNKIKI